MYIIRVHTFSLWSIQKLSTVSLIVLYLITWNLPCGKTKIAYLSFFLFELLYLLWVAKFKLLHCFLYIYQLVWKFRKQKCLWLNSSERRRWIIQLICVYCTYNYSKEQIMSKSPQVCLCNWDKIVLFEWLMFKITIWINFTIDSSLTVKYWVHLVGTSIFYILIFLWK